MKTTYPENSCLGLSAEVQEASRLPDPEERITQLQRLKRRALEDGCETVALVALFHVVPDLLVPGNERELSEVQAEIVELQARPTVIQALSKPKSDDDLRAQKELEECIQRKTR